MKKIVTLIVALLVALSMTACSSENDSEKIQVVLWHTYTDDQADFIDEVVAEFNANQDNIEVVAESQDATDFSSMLNEAVSTGTGPNLIINLACEAANYVADGLVADLGQYVDEDFAETVDEGVYAEATSFADGKMHILPLFTSGPVFYYNATIYEELGLEVPTTWDELIDNCEAIQEAYSDKYGFAFDSLIDGGQTLIMQTGNEIIDVETLQATFYTTEVAEQIQMFADAVADGLFMLTASEQSLSSDFNSENLVSYIGSVDDVASISLPDGSTYAVAAIPQVGTVEWTQARNLGVIVFSANDEVEAAAAEFALYLATPEVNAALCVATNNASPYAATRETETYQEFIAENSALDCIRSDISGSFAAIVGISAVRDEMEGLLTAVATGTDVETALADAVEACTKALREA